MSLVQYASSILNPFNRTVQQPKLLDGKVARSSGIRLRTTGEIICNSTEPTYIAIVPGFSNIICWRATAVGSASGVDSDERTPPPFQGHLEVNSNRAIVKATRTVAAGVRLSLVNSATQNEGYWEAARILTDNHEYRPHREDGVIDPNAPTNTTTYKMLEEIDISHHDSYQSGKLHNLNTMEFNLNPIDDNIEFSKIETVNDSGDPIEQFMSEKWDTILIKIHGRPDANSPSVIKFDCMSCQEVLYKENTTPARQMTPSKYIPQTKKILTRRSRMPGRKIVAF